MHILDKYLNLITTYRLMLYFLIVIVVVAAVFGFVGSIPFTGFEIIGSTVVAVAACYISNYLFSRIFNAVTNIESVFITALILVLIFPVDFPGNIFALVGVSFVAMGSKYLLTIQKRHVFNPAAIAVFMVGLLFPNFVATWWVGTTVLVVPILIGGLISARKIGRSRMIGSFLATFILACGISELVGGGSIAQILTLLKQSALSSALFFFTFVMLVEPLTSPVTKKLQAYYGILVGLFYATPLLHIGFAFTPEMALILGNVYSYVVSPKYRFELKLREKVKISPDTFLFVFDHLRNFSFKPGQFLEWTLPHSNSDSRGNRRYFSIASAPHEDLMVAVKFYNHSSSFKKALLNLPAEGKIIASGLSGDFTLQENGRPSVFIAGGVGIAPFRSILEDIVAKKSKVDIVVIFANKKPEDIIFQDTLSRAWDYGVRTMHVLTDRTSVPKNWNGYVGHITESVIRTEIPDFDKRIFYISGPQLMVRNFEQILLSLGIRRRNIKMDFFPGYQEEHI